MLAKQVEALGHQGSYTRRKMKCPIDAARN